MAKASISVAELLAGGSWNQPATIDNRRRRIVTDGVVHCNAISPGFFDTLGVPILAGRISPNVTRATMPM